VSDGGVHNNDSDDVVVWPKSRQKGKGNIADDVWLSLEDATIAVVVEC